MLLDIIRAHYQFAIVLFGQPKHALIKEFIIILESQKRKRFRP